MPTPNTNESQEDFVSRCIPIVMREGGSHKEPRAAAAKCYGIWRQHKKGK